LKLPLKKLFQLKKPINADDVADGAEPSPEIKKCILVDASE
jgi:hypothetical protein